MFWPHPPLMLCHFYFIIIVVKVFIYCYLLLFYQVLNQYLMSSRWINQGGSRADRSGYQYAQQVSLLRGVPQRIAPHLLQETHSF